jgi:hypothetical protein
MTPCEKALIYYKTELKARDEEMKALRKKSHDLQRQIASLRSQTLHWKALSEKIRAEFDAPALFPETKELRELFPRFPFIHLSQQRVLLFLWDALQQGNKNFISKYEIHDEIYKDRPAHARPTPQTINVFICHLRRSLQGHPLTILAEHGKGWKLAITEEAKNSELSSPETENFSP